VGRDSVVEALRRNFSLVTEQRPRVIEMVESEDVIAIRMEEGGRIAETNALYSVRGIQWFRFEQGKLKIVEEFLQPLPVLPEWMP
jgi:hypothetical protein